MSSSVLLEVKSQPYDGGKQKSIDGGDSNVNELKILWIDISYLSQSSQFLVCCLAIFIFYLLYGYLQVRIELKLCLFCFAFGSVIIS